MARSAHRHTICGYCKLDGNDRNTMKIVAKIEDPGLELCCYCNKMTNSGWRTDEDPVLLLCNGAHRGGGPGA
jgi:hypothetical protein